MSLQSFGRIAASQIGFVEGGGPDGKSGNITPYGAWYGLQGNPWCAMGLSWVAARSGDLAAFGGKWAYCPSWVNHFKNAGQWGQTPRVGAIVFFNFGANEAVHVEWVESVHPGHVTTIGFNTGPDNASSQNNGGGCYRRNRSTTWGVEGYGYPVYTAIVPTPVPAPRPAPKPKPRPSVITPVDLDVDGILGPLTMKALQRWVGTPADGVYGFATKKALQRRLGVRDDGVVGKITIRALQGRVGAVVDGGWGRLTTMALQRYLNRI